MAGGGAKKVGSASSRTSRRSASPLSSVPIQTNGKACPTIDRPSSRIAKAADLKRFKREVNLPAVPESPLPRAAATITGENEENIVKNFDVVSDSSSDSDTVDYLEDTHICEGPAGSMATAARSSLSPTSNHFNSSFPTDHDLHRELMKERNRRSVTCVSDDDSLNASSGIGVPRRAASQLTAGAPDNLRCIQEVPEDSVTVVSGGEGEAKYAEVPSVDSPKRSGRALEQSCSCCHTTHGKAEAGGVTSASDGGTMVTHKEEGSCSCRAKPCDSLDGGGLRYASGLSDCFTYGVQASLRYYEQSVRGISDESRKLDADGRHHDALAVAAASPYGNSFLNETTLSHASPGESSTVQNASRSISGASTCDSEHEGLAGSARGAAMPECLLAPEQTSLFRPRMRTTPARCETGERHLSTEESWLDVGSSAAASTAAGEPPTTQKEPSGAPLNERTTCGVHAYFRKALQHAYQCEDAYRQQRRAEWDMRRIQAIRATERMRICSHGELATMEGSSADPNSSDQPRGGTSGVSEGEATVAATGQVPGEVSDVQRFLLTSQWPAAVAGGDSSTGVTIPRTLQVMSPGKAQRLRQPLTPFADALRHRHQEAQRKAKAAWLAEDQAIKARRMYELPVLTEDITRYVALLLCLRRQNDTGGDGDAIAERVAPSSQGGCKTEKSPSSPPHGSPTSPLEPPSLHTARQSGGDATTVSFGEQGALLYLKYPAPLLRTTSFAVETVRLLKWLRTWKTSGPSVAGTPFTASASTPRCSIGRKCSAPTSSGHGALHPRCTPAGGAPQVLMGTEVDLQGLRNGNTDYGGAHDSEGVEVPQPVALPSPAAKTAMSPPNRSTLDQVRREAHHTLQLQENQLKQDKKSAFLRFFGAAAVNRSSNAVEVTNEVRIAGHADEEAPSSGVREIVRQSSDDDHLHHPFRDEHDNGTEKTSSPIQSSSEKPTNTAFATPRSSRTFSPSQAYHVYAQAWKRAVRTGITPLATAAQAFIGASTAAVAPTPAPGKEDDWTGGCVSRVCAALPFFKEMREEARRTALGSAGSGAYYEDAFGNRLRSARLAKKEQVRRELLAAQRRRRARKKGYFHRDGDDEEGLGMIVSTSHDPCAMLEAMVRSPSARRSGTLHQTPLFSEQHQQRNKRSGHRSNDTCDDEDMSGGPANVETVGERRTGWVQEGQSSRHPLPRMLSPSSSITSSHASSRGNGSSTSAASESEDDDGTAMDELTNIAVVSGPTGSGKTAAVYMAAHLLGFRVVEMNASVRRCSKSVEHLLAELTRSYRLNSLRSGAPGTFNAEEELTKLKQQHANMIERVKAEAEAAEREAERKKKETRKANGISVQAVAAFFSKKGKRDASALSKHARNTEDRTALSQPAQPSTGEVVVVDGDTSTAAATATIKTQAPPTPAPSSAVAARTLLLFEDADTLLGDESAKPFYAAIRDLAHRSKVPIVVTVSSDPSASQRYDTDSFLALSETSAMSSTQEMAVSQPTYWQLCGEAGLTSTMATMDAAQSALQLQYDPSGRCISGSLMATATASCVSFPSSVGVTEVASGTAPYGESNSNGGGAGLPPTGCVSNGSAGMATTGGGSVGALASIGGAAANSSSSCSTGTSATVAAAAAAASNAARYTHVVLNSTLVSNFFGPQTPFTVVDPLSSSALYAQLLAVGSVELNLFSWGEPSSPSDGEESAASVKQPPTQSTSPGPLASGAGWQHQLDSMTARLTLRDVDVFFDLARLLQTQIFGAHTTIVSSSSCGEMAPVPTTPSSAGFMNVIQHHAASSTTTDIRFWLNRLQILLLSMQRRKPHDAAGTTVGPSDKPTLMTANARKRARDELEDVALSYHSVTSKGGFAKAAGSRYRAERLVEFMFQRSASLAASAWDTALGRYMASISHNEQHSTRYEHWFLENLVAYMPDIVEELATINHPTSRVDYLAPSATPALLTPTASRRGRPSSPAQAKRSARNDLADVHASTPVSGSRQRVFAEAPHASTSSASGRPKVLAWQSFFATAGISAAASSPPSSPATQSAANAIITAATPPSLCAPARYEWPPNARELSQRAHSDAHLRAVELLLPYGAAELYYALAASSSAPAVLMEVHPHFEWSAAFLGHEPALRFPTRPKMRDSAPSLSLMDDAAGGAEEDLELPAGVHPTQQERCEVFRRWWRRTRKVGAVRDSVAGRSSEALEDMLGFSSLLTPSAVAALYSPP